MFGRLPNCWRPVPLGGDVVSSSLESFHQLDDRVTQRYLALVRSILLRVFVRSVLACGWRVGFG